MMRAHPRSRGENDGDAVTVRVMVGSSPLTRGKPEVSVRRVERRGLIPAHAGKTRKRSSLPSCRRGSSPLTRGKLIIAPGDATPGVAHPRSRGENSRVRCSRASHGGSSPLTRGKRRESVLDEQGPGLIPAHAGKTRRRWRGGACGRAHPRSRGENILATCDRMLELGSSPLTRGKRWSESPWIDFGGLIPAHAGKTLGSRRG